MRNYTAQALMLLATTAAAIGSYTVNLKVSGERAAVTDLQRRLVADARDIRGLEAELRTRARLPEMQRWNDNVLQMSAPVASQYLRSPLQLASLVAPPANVAAAPALQYAVTAPEPLTPPTAPVAAGYRPSPAAAAPATLVRAGFALPRRPDPAAVAPPAAGAPKLVRAAYAPPPAPRAPTGAAADTAPRDLLPDAAQ